MNHKFFHCIFLYAVICLSCNQNKNKNAISKPEVFNSITITQAGLTCTDAQLQDPNGKIITAENYTTEEGASLKLFVTGYTPKNGMVNILGTLTITDSLNNIVFNNSNYFNNIPLSNGDARFINMPFNINKSKAKSKGLTLKASITEQSTKAALEAIINFKTKF